MDDKILFLYAQGMTTREICTAFKELYDADVSASLISKVNQCGNGTSCRMVITPARSGISYCLPWLYCGQNSSEQAGYQQSDIPSPWCYTNPRKSSATR